jgi:DNA-binding SARP family transcriptional activator
VGQQPVGQRVGSTHRPVGATRIGVFGPIAVDGAPALERPSHRRLLAILLLEGELRVRVDTLIERFWPMGPPRTAKGAIHTHVSALRHLTPAGMITSDCGGYGVAPDRVRVDRDDFVNQVASAQRMSRVHRWNDVVTAADQARAAWSGEPFTDLADDVFAEPEISRLCELRLQTIELRAEALLQLGRARESIADLEWATRSFPLRESLSSLLAVARQATGAHADALRSLRATETALAELGLEPSPALRALEHQILNHRAIVGAVEAPVDLRSA